MSKIVASFNNSREPILGLIDPDTGEQSYQTLQLQEIKGITGLTVSDGNICAALQLVPFGSAIAILDAQTFAVRTVQILDANTANDVHSIFVGYQKLYVVSTATDELLSYQFNGNEITSPSVVMWRPDPALPRGDFHHLTSVWEKAGVVHVAGFGRKADKDEALWSTALKGFVYNVTQHTSVVTDVQHPHSASLVEEVPMFCESLPGILHTPDKDVTLGGYLRGLCAVGPSVFVGSSIGRDGTGQCKVVQLKQEDLTQEREYVFGEHGNEIYDLIYIP